jgi:hypothetical protein
MIRGNMIKVISPLTRKDAISHADFVRHWFDIHGHCLWQCQASPVISNLTLPNIDSSRRSGNGGGVRRYRSILV